MTDMEALGRQQIRDLGWREIAPIAALVGAFGECGYAVPREGEHGKLACLFGRHWWALVRRVRDGAPVAVVCPVCWKMLQIHDQERAP